MSIPFTLDGQPLAGYLLSGANQEHGIVSLQGAADTEIVRRLPTGTRLRVLPNHACATGAQFPEYQALAEDGKLPTQKVADAIAKAAPKAKAKAAAPVEKAGK